MNIFFKLPVIASNSIGTLDPGDVRDVSDFFPGVESNAFEHWTLNKDLVGTVNNRNLFPTAETNYEILESKLVLSEITQAIRKGFNTDLKNSSVTGFTICVVAKQAGITSGFATLAGNQQELPGTASLLVYANQIAGYATGLGFTSAPNAQLDTSNWFFAAASYSSDANVVRNMVVESGDYFFENTFVGTGKLVDPPISNIFNSIALGTSQVNSTQSFSLEYGEYIIFNKALSIKELKAIAFRSKKRMLQKGITI